MHLGQHRAPAIPFWCTFLAACCILVGTACSDRNQSAAQSAFVAQQALGRNDLFAARAAIAAAISERDDIVDYHLLRGRIELALDSPGAAYNAFSNALALDATNGEALLAVAELGLTTGNLRESLEATEQVLTLAPNNLDALLVRGIHSIIKRDYPEAIEYGDRILAISPGHEGGTILKSRALFMSRKPREALATLEGIAGAAADSIPAALTRLEIHRALRQPEPMSTEYGKLRKLRPNDLALRTDEANVRFKLGERAEAHALVAGVLGNPEADGQAADLALALWQEYGASDVPSELFRTINRTGSVIARRAFARFLIDQGRTADAGAALRALQDEASAGLQARHLVLGGKASEGLRLARRTLEVDETDCDALIAASEGALSDRHAADALRYAQLASSECPNQAGAWIAAARAYGALGRTSGVNRVYVQALEANKQSGELTAAYTRWLVSESRPREAVAMARRLTRYAPALISGWDLYGDLCRRFAPGCVSQAVKGRANAETLFGVDLPPGASPPNGLFGRLVER